jgi:hypothetical protein
MWAKVRLPVFVCAEALPDQNIAPAMKATFTAAGLGFQLFNPSD